MNRSRAKQYGLNLSEYALGAMLSPEVSPSGTTTPPTTRQRRHHLDIHRVRRSPAAVERHVAAAVQREHHLARLQHQPISTSPCPTAIVRFLESDTQTKLIAKPQLRGAEGNKMTLNLGDEIPIVTTSYTPIATGGARREPAELVSVDRTSASTSTSRQFASRSKATSCIDLIVESSSRGSDVNIARHQLSVVRIAEGQRPAATARRRIESARGAAARGRAQSAGRIPRRHQRARPASSCFRATTRPSDRPTS